MKIPFDYTQTIYLGVRGSYGVNTIEFDFTGYEDLTSVYLAVIRPGETIPHLRTVTIEKQIVNWTPQAWDTDVVGFGRIQLRIQTTDGKDLTRIFKTSVSNSLTVSDEDVPEPEQDFLDQMIAVRDEADAAATLSQTYAEQASDYETQAETVKIQVDVSAANAKMYADQAAASASSASTSSASASGSASSASGSANSASSSASQAKAYAEEAKQSVNQVYNTGEAEIAKIIAAGDKIANDSQQIIQTVADVGNQKVDEVRREGNEILSTTQISAKEAEYDADRAEHAADVALTAAARLTIPSSRVVSSFIVEDITTGEKWQFIVDNGRLSLLGVDPEFEAGDYSLVDISTSTIYSLVVDNGKLKLEEQ